jgi:uncharacterized C2H2 Zn-finger protein
LEVGTEDKKISITGDQVHYAIRCDKLYDKFKNIYYHEDKTHLEKTGSKIYIAEEIKYKAVDLKEICKNKYDEKKSVHTDIKVGVKCPHCGKDIVGNFCYMEVKDIIEKSKNEKYKVVDPEKSARKVSIDEI